MGILDAPAVTPSALGIKTRRGFYLTGTNGTTTTYGNSGGVGSIRLVMRLPVTPTRYRFKIRNYNTATSTAQTALAGKGISIGAHVSAADGFETGNVVGGNLTPLVAAGFTIPGDGSWYTSPWFTAADFAITPMQQFVLAMGYDGGGSLTLPRGIGQAWATQDLTLLTGSTSAPGTPLANTPLEFQVEYDWNGSQRVGLIIGDSISEGLGGQSSLGNLPFYSWPALWGARQGIVTANIAASGTTSGNWAGGTTNSYWQRAALSTIAPDFAVIALGANDANNSTTLATYISNMESITSSVRTLFGEIPIYTVNVTPRSLETSVKEPLRLSYNNWLEALPMRTAACFDMDAAVRDPATSTQLLGAPTANNIYNYDGTHFTRRGYNKMAQVPGRIHV